MRKLNIVEVSTSTTEIKIRENSLFDILFKQGTRTTFLSEEEFLKTKNIPDVDILILRGKMLDESENLNALTGHLLRYYIGKKVISLSTNGNYKIADELGIVHPKGINDLKDAVFWEKITDDIYKYETYSFLKWEWVAAYNVIMEEKK